MLYFIFILKVLATILITNTHYTDVYPYDLMASGGLLGNVIFLWVTGYLLINVKHINFFKWYYKKLKRIYPIVWIPTLLFILIGFYSLQTKTILEYFIFPTDYHFVGSIIILYIPYFFVMNFPNIKKYIKYLVIGLFVFQLVLYFTIYDLSYYHIDNVREPMIRFLFFYAMLLGSYFRLNSQKYLSNRNSLTKYFMALFTLLYLISKLIFSKYSGLSIFQLGNQIILLIALYFIVKFFMSLEEIFSIKLKNMIKIIKPISNITLEIYVVQFFIIYTLQHLIFPYNFILITFSILFSAFVLHYIIKGINLFSNYVVNQVVLKKRY